MKLDIKTTFLVHYDPKINLNRLKSKPVSPEHIGQYNVNCLIQTLSLRYLPVQVQCYDGHLTIKFDRDISINDLEHMKTDLRNCVILHDGQFITVIPETNLWASIG